MRAAERRDGMDSSFAGDQMNWIEQVHGSIRNDDSGWHVKIVPAQHERDAIEITACVLSVAITTAQAAYKAHYYGK